MSSKGKGCHSAKCRRAFLHKSIKNGNSKDIKSYFKLMGRLGAKDARFTKYLKSDLKYFVQRGGNECDAETKTECTYPCIWNEELSFCHSVENAMRNPVKTSENSTLEAEENARRKKIIDELKKLKKINSNEKLLSENTIDAYMKNSSFTADELQKIYNTIITNYSITSTNLNAELAELEAKDES